MLIYKIYLMSRNFQLKYYKNPRIKSEEKDGVDTIELHPRKHAKKKQARVRIYSRACLTREAYGFEVLRE